MHVASRTPGPASAVGVALRGARATDAAAMWALVHETGALEPNTPYAYLLLCTHFADTTVVATRDDGALIGFVAAYRPPVKPDVVFVWQIGVAPAARGAGLGKRLLRALIALPGCADVRALEATVMPSNTASRELFRAFARTLGVHCTRRPGFPADLFPRVPGDAAPHEAEELFHIGPLGKEPL